MPIPFPTRRSVTALAFAAAAMLAVACGSDSATGPTGADLMGTWNLQTVNGQPLPFHLPAYEGTDSVVMNSGTLTLTPSTWSFTGSIVAYAQGMTIPTSTPAGGTYTQSGNSLTFMSGAESSDVHVTVDGNTLTAAGVELGGGAAGGDTTTYTLVFK
jgi:hypothetical protein